MLVVTQGAEWSFSKELDACSRDDLWRCLVLKFSQADRKPGGWFSEVTDKIQHCIGDDNGRIFLFPNDDVYVLAKNITQKNFHAMLGHLAPALAPISILSLSYLYELPGDKAKIEKFIRDTRAALLTSQVQAEPAAPSLYIDADHQPYVETIAARREKRGHIGVLIVEDDPFSRRLVGKSLETQFEITTADTGQEAIFAYIRSAPDIVFLDIGLPDTNGLDVLAKLQEIDPKVYVVMLSANGNKSNVLKAVENGAKSFVAKPFAREKLIQSINKCPTVIAKSKKSRSVQ